VKEAVKKEILYVTGLEPKVEDQVEHQVEQLTKYIQ
jgi:hypothetical protein